MTPAQIERAAHALLRARSQRVRLPRFPADCTPLTSADAEAICEAMARGLEQPIGGWKVGCTDPGMPSKLGLAGPFCGQVPDRLIHANGASLSYAELMRAVIEPEIVFKLGCDLAPRAAAYSRAEVMAAIEALYPSLEIPESRLIDAHPHGALGMVADQGYAGRIVLGPRVQNWRSLALPAQQVSVAINDHVVARGSAARAMGDPIEAVVWLANYRSHRGDGLKAGQVVSTGTLTGIIPVQPGDLVIADYGALGEVKLLIET